mmetsp:Transcript_102376/g.184672  ORF Transcript_102376/g.184672 Transcript_102376/m.184672 type:complete len:470 (+) Transcript_102376:1101-2510(+)
MLSSFMVFFMWGDGSGQGEQAVVSRKGEVLAGVEHVWLPVAVLLVANPRWLTRHLDQGVTAHNAIHDHAPAKVEELEGNCADRHAGQLPRQVWGALGAELLEGRGPGVGTLAPLVGGLELCQVLRDLRQRVRDLRHRLLAAGLAAGELVDLPLGRNVLAPEIREAALAFLWDLGPDALLEPPLEGVLQLRGLGLQRLRGACRSARSGNLVLCALAATATGHSCAGPLQRLHLVQEVVLAWLQLLWRRQKPEVLAECRWHSPVRRPPGLARLIRHVLVVVVWPGQVQHAQSHGEVAGIAEEDEDPGDGHVLRLVCGAILQCGGSDGKVGSQVAEPLCVRQQVVASAFDDIQAEDQCLADKEHHRQRPGDPETAQLGHSGADRVVGDCEEELDGAKEHQNPSIHVVLPPLLLCLGKKLEVFWNLVVLGVLDGIGPHHTTGLVNDLLVANPGGDGVARSAGKVSPHIRPGRF